MAEKSLISLNIHMTTRNQEIDISKGICILLMIIGHCPELPLIPFRAIESFHMPFFFIASGLFFTPVPFTQKVYAGFKRLIVPMLIGVAICAGITYLFGDVNGALAWIKALLYPGGTGANDLIAPFWPHIGVFWFLAALFWCKIIYAIIDAYLQKYKLVACVLLSWSAVITSHHLMLPFGITEGISALVFYAFGHYVMQKNWENKALPWYVFVLFISAWIINIHLMHFQMWQCRCWWFLWPIGMFYACGMSKVVYTMAQILNRHMWGNALMTIGLHSLVFLCCHQVIRTTLIMLKLHHGLFVDPLYFSMMLISGSIVLSIAYIFAKKVLVRRDKM